MTALELKFLGGLDIHLDNTPLTTLKSGKGKALLCYLAVSGGVHSRSALAGLLWTDLSEENARANLRKTLSRIKPYLGHFLNITRETINFNQDALYCLDVAEFEAGTSSGLDFHLLQEGVSLYTGDFLQGFYLPDALLFNEWVQAQRARLRERVLDALQTVVNHFIELGEYDSGITYARRLLGIEPWHEETHRGLMYMLASSGQRSAALKQFEECQQKLGEELGVEPSLLTVKVFEQIQRGELDSESALDEISGLDLIRSHPSPYYREPHISSLPPLTTPLIGRQRELEKLYRLLTDPDVRLVTIAGMGGIGKTQLSLTIAHQLAKADRFHDGVFFVPLSSVTTHSRLISAIAEQLDLSLAGSRQPEGILFDFLQDKACLLVLDNFEQLLPEVDFLTLLFQVIPQGKILVTSRERLKLREEWVLDLDGLRYANSVQEAQASDYDAILLFFERAKQIRSSFSLEEEILGVVRICKLTQGMPLALEQAASLMRASRAAEIADQIEERLDALATTLRNLPERHRSMRAAFDGTWRWLSGEEQKIFCRLSIFRGSFTREAAEQVVEANFHILASLVDKSLLRIMANQVNTTRYDMHELVRQYAAERLLEMGQSEVIQVGDSHLDYFLSLSECAEKTWDTTEEREWLKHLEGERSNLHAALHWATEHAKTEHALRLNAALFTFWIYNSPAAEAVAWLNASLSMAWDECSSTTMQARAKALNVAGYAALSISDLRSAKVHFEEGARLYTALGDQRGLAWSLRGRGFVCLIRGDLTEAQTFAEESHSNCQEFQDEWGSAWSTYDLGNIALAGAEFDLAESMLESALAQFRKVGIQFGTYRAFISLGHLKRVQGKWAESKAHYREALNIQSKTQYIQFVAQILEGMGHIGVAESNPQVAVQFFGAARARRDSIEMQRWAHHEAEYQQSLVLTRDQMPTSIWQAAWDKGYAMTSQQGVDFAVASLESL